MRGPLRKEELEEGEIEINYICVATDREIIVSCFINRLPFNSTGTRGAAVIIALGGLWKLILFFKEWCKFTRVQ